MALVQFLSQRPTTTQLMTLTITKLITSLTTLDHIQQQDLIIQNPRSIFKEEASVTVSVPKRRNMFPPTHQHRSNGGQI